MSELLFLIAGVIVGTLFGSTIRPYLDKAWTWVTSKFNTKS